MNERRLFTITKLCRDDAGVWSARVTVNGHGIDVDRRFGSWMTAADDGEYRRDLLPDVAAALQAKVSPIENAERIAREKLGKLDEKKSAEEITTLRNELLSLEARARGIPLVVTNDQHGVDIAADNPFLAGLAVSSS